MCKGGPTTVIRVSRTTPRSSTAGLVQHTPTSSVLTPIILVMERKVGRPSKKTGENKKKEGEINHFGFG